MTSTYQELLKNRIERLSAEDYELEAWKTGTSLLMNRIFGEENSYSKALDNLKVDYSSWNLRDATSDYNPKETCRRQGQEILELALAEMTMTTDHPQAPDYNDILEDKSGKLQEAIAEKDEAAIFKILMKENKERLVKLMVKLIS